MCNLGSIEMEETVLIQATSQGNLTAFNELVLKYQDQVFNLAHRILDNQDMAEDIAQDTFIHAFQKIHQFRGGSFRAWLLKIATNLCYDEMRIWKRHPYQPLEPTDKENNINESPQWLRDPNPLPERMVETDDLHEILENAISKLPNIYRTTLSLIDIDEFDYKEAASIMGISIGTVKSRLARGRMQLGSYLKDTAKPYISEPKYFT
jgi:RNA polymerase sigma-70 factor (ECF subfamily)